MRLESLCLAKASGLLSYLQPGAPYKVGHSFAAVLQTARFESLHVLVWESSWVVTLRSYQVLAEEAQKRSGSKKKARMLAYQPTGQLVQPAIESLVEFKRANVPPGSA